MSIARTRLDPAASRALALAAARDLLVKEGPQAVTLPAVAKRIGKRHGTLLHHFGSAAGLQSALAARLAEEITAKVVTEVLSAGPGLADRPAIANLVFDALSREGGGALAARMIANGDLTALDPVLAVLDGLVAEIGERDGRPVRERTLLLVLLALGDALVGAPVARALALPADTARQIAARLIASEGPIDLPGDAPGDAAGI